MKSRYWPGLILILLCLVSSSTVLAQAPTTITYQGRLVLAEGQPVSGPTPVVFSLYRDAEGGLPVWTESQTVIPDELGVFAVELGSQIPIPLVQLDGNKRWLGIKVGGDDEMTPRQLLTSVPYALKVASLATSAVTTLSIANGAVTSLKVSNNSLVAEDLKDEPGLAAADSLSDKLLPPASNPDTISLLSNTIDCPTSGWVLAVASLEVFISHLNGVTSEASFGVSDNPAAFVANTDLTMLISQAAGTGSYVQGMTVQSVFSVEPGVTTFYLLGTVLESGSGQVIASARQLNLLFVPTNYEQTVTTTASAGMSGAAGPEAHAARSSDLDDASYDELQTRVQLLEERLRQLEMIRENNQ